jgi:hypothetical protein
LLEGEEGGVATTGALLPASAHAAYPTG